MTIQCKRNPIRICKKRNIMGITTSPTTAVMIAMMVTDKLEKESHRSLMISTIIMMRMRRMQKGLVELMPKGTEFIIKLIFMEFIAKLK